jgi:hypothetical protein
LKKRRWDLYFIYNISEPDLDAGIFYIKPYLKYPVLFVDKHYQQTVTVLPYEKVNVTELQFIPFASGGLRHSDFRLKAVYKGQEGFLVGYRGALSNKDPLYGVRSKYKSAVKENKLMFGMNLDEVVLSLGFPDKTEVYDVYKTETGFNVDYDGGLAKHYSNNVGSINVITYVHIPYGLVIDMNGKFKKGRQIFGQPKFKGKLPFMVW